MLSHELLGCLSRGGSYIQLSSTSNLSMDQPEARRRGGRLHRLRGKVSDQAQDVSERLDPRKRHFGPLGHPNGRLVSVLRWPPFAGFSAQKSLTRATQRDPQKIAPGWSMTTR